MPASPSAPAPPTAAAAKVSSDASAFWTQKFQTTRSTLSPASPASSAALSSTDTTSDSSPTTVVFPIPWLRLSAKTAPEPSIMSAQEEFERVIAAKDQRIQQLEVDIEEKQIKIADLVAKGEKTNAKIAEMQSEASEQREQSNALIERITNLESELAKKSTVAEGSVAESDSSTQVCDDHDAIPVQEDGIDPATVYDDTTGSKAKDEQVSSNSTATEHKTAAVSTQASSRTSEKQNATSTASASPKNSPKKDIKGPAFDDREFPLMWTPDAPKAKPVAKPKVLKMAVDMSKYGKKTVEKAPHTSSDEEVYILNLNAAQERELKTGEVPSIDPHLDIRQMSYEKRVQFAAGPCVDVMMGKTKLAVLPQYLLAQCSRKAYEYFNKTPTATSITFPDGSMDIAAAIAHLTWMGEMTYQHRVYSVNARHGAKYNELNLKICQAARVMGLTGVYVGHFTKMFCDHIRSGNATQEFLSLVCNFAVPANDPIFDCLANCLAMKHNKIGVPAAGVELLAGEFPALKTKMEKVQRRQKSSEQ